MSEESSEQIDLTGKTLGQYAISRRLGQGGMATVYLAEQPSINRQVAVKIMPAYFLHDPTFLKRFNQEVKVIARLQHPRILPVYDFGRFEGQPYIVMAYMSGGTLADRIRKGGPMPLDTVVQIVKQIAEGLDHAHKNGIIHRDFKPSNVLLDDSGNAYLADFGIAKVSESTAQLTGSAIVGTPTYMAPEMADQGIVSPSIDIYALGVTIYEMLTGQYPYVGDTPLRVMMAHVNNPIPDVLDTRPNLPVGVSEVLKRAMAKNPGARYNTAAELASALEAAASGQPLPAPPVDIYEALTEDIPAEEFEEQRAAPHVPTPMAAHTPSIAQAGAVHADAAQIPTVREMPEVKQRRFPVALVVVIGVLVCGALVIGLVVLGGAKALGFDIAQINPLAAQPTDIPPREEEAEDEPEQEEQPDEPGVLVITATSKPGQPAPTDLPPPTNPPPPSDTPRPSDTPTPNPEDDVIEAILFFDEEMRYLLGTNDTSRMDQAARGEALTDRYHAAEILRQAGDNFGTDPCIWVYDHKGIDIEEVYFINSVKAEVYALVKRSGTVFCGGIEQPEYAFRGPCTAVYTVELFGDKWYVTEYDADCVE
jgi:tRNA A-37 threonylcarbamoyl transferase component Bud32